MDVKRYKVTGYEYDINYADGSDCPVEDWPEEPLVRASAFDAVLKDRDALQGRNETYCTLFADLMGQVDALASELVAERKYADQQYSASMMYMNQAMENGGAALEAAGKLKVAVAHMRHPIGCYVTKLPTIGVSYTFMMGDPTVAPSCTCGLNEALAQIGLPEKEG